MERKDKSSNYKPAEDREKDLRLALYRIQKGLARTGEAKVSIAVVTREAGASTALIHNHYLGIAEAVREAQGCSSRAIRDMKRQDLIAECMRYVASRQEILEVRAKVANLASLMRCYWTRTVYSRPK